MRLFEGKPCMSGFGADILAKMIVKRFPTVQATVVPVYSGDKFGPHYVKYECRNKVGFMLSFESFMKAAETENSEIRTIAGTH